MGGRSDTEVKKLQSKQYGGELFFIFPLLTLSFDIGQAELKNCTAGIDSKKKIKPKPSKQTKQKNLQSSDIAG